jgi:hypothetical protein
VRSIIADEIRAFRGLLCHERNDSMLGLDFLERIGFFHKGVNVVNNVNQVNDTVVAIHLSQDRL